MANAIPPRVTTRPAAVDWDMDELMTLPEAVALFWPDGLLTVTNLRRAIEKEQLAHVRISRKVLTSRASILRMTQCATYGPKDVPEPAGPVVDPEEQQRLRQAVYGRRRRAVRP